MSTATIKKETEKLKEGGTWTDARLEESLDWAGETAAPLAGQDSTRILEPKTQEEIDKEEMSASNISPEMLMFIANKVQRVILQSSGSEHNTLIQMVEERISNHGDSVSKWIGSQSQRIALLEQQSKDANAESIRRIDEKIASLEVKVDTLIGNIVTHGPEEARMIHEAHRIIVERKTSDANDEDNSEPSVYGRFEKRSEQLAEQLRNLEPLADSGIKAKVAVATTQNEARKKFGRRM